VTGRPCLDRAPASRAPASRRAGRPPRWPGG